MRALCLVATAMLGCGVGSPTEEAPERAPVTDTSEETPAAPPERAVEASPDPAAANVAPDPPAPACSPKRCLAHAEDWRGLVASVREECHAAGRRLTPEGERWSDRPRDRDSFHVIRRDRPTGDPIIDRVGSLRCDVTLTSAERRSAVWVAFHEEAGWHGCELAVDLADIYVAEMTPRQIVTAQWIEGGPPEVVTRVTIESNASDAGESDRSTTAERHVCGLEGGEAVCWGALLTELESYTASQSCDDDGRCETSERRREGRLHVEPAAGDRVRLVRGEGALAEREREVSLRALPCQ